MACHKVAQLLLLGDRQRNRSVPASMILRLAKSWQRMSAGINVVNGTEMMAHKNVAFLVVLLVLFFLRGRSSVMVHHFAFVNQLSATDVVNLVSSPATGEPTVKFEGRHLLRHLEQVPHQTYSVVVSFGQCC